jgi:hypothetical protein
MIRLLHLMSVNIGKGTPLAQHSQHVASCQYFECHFCKLKFPTSSALGEHKRSDCVRHFWHHQNSEGSNLSMTLNMKREKDSSELSNHNKLDPLHKARRRVPWRIIGTSLSYMKIDLADILSMLGI